MNSTLFGCTTQPILRIFLCEAAGNVFFFFGNGLVGGVAIGAACLVETDLVPFCSGEAAAATPPEVPFFLFLDPLGLAHIGLLGVCYGGAEAGALAAYPSAVMTTMISSSYFVSVGVRVTLAAATSSSTSICSTFSSEARGLITFSLPLLEMTRKGGSSTSSSSSFCVMCFFLDLEEVLTRGSSSSFSRSSSASVGELSIADLTSSFSGWSD